jgi:hypothetical protein
VSGDRLLRTAAAGKAVRGSSMSAMLVAFLLPLACAAQLVEPAQPGPAGTAGSAMPPAAARIGATSLDELILSLEGAVGEAPGDVELLGTLLARDDILLERRILMRRAPFAYREELTWRPPPGAAPDAAPPAGVERHAVYLSDGLCAWTLADENGPGGLLPGTSAVALLDNALLFRLLLDPRASLAALDRPARLVTRELLARKALRGSGARMGEEALLLAARQSTVWHAFVERASGRMARVVDATGATGRGFELAEWRAWDGLMLPAAVIETLPKGGKTLTQWHAARAGLAHDGDLFGGGPDDHLDDVTDAGALRLVHSGVPGSAQFMLTDVDVTAGEKRLRGVWTGFDTGASALYAETSLAEHMGLPVVAREFSLGSQGGGRNIVHWLDKLRVGGHFLLQVPVSAVDFPRSPELPADRPMVLVLGGPRLLERNPVLDMAAGRLLLRGRDGTGAVEPLAAIAGRPALEVPLVDDGLGRPLVDVAIGGRTIRTLLDTGYGEVLRLMRSDLRRLGLPDDDASWLARGALVTSGAGAMGHVGESLLVRLDQDVSFGPVTLRTPWVSIAPASHELPDSGVDAHSLLGGGALLPFAQAGFDWAGKQLELVPPSRAGAGDTRTFTAAVPGEFLGFAMSPPAPHDPPWPRNLPRVEVVADGLPAARAGLRVGDALATIDGAPCDGAAPGELWPRLWPVAGDGRCAVEVGVVRDGAVPHVVIEVP